ncbi:aminotransferase class III-fold pyridoxal phosphate-dependent enzyme [Bradyrhizobium sp. CCBAU 51753]|uniref:aminotransferase class III-fold pyridoxal phosphate-dependent enzyme n=1 Tax=Bradyrhizobium sp. CCBAU 51753 TaxID=1325100 RepID=UPI001FF01C3E|nr:aminotransferase class III-fold pyridoxal phosphate-dependent enzyme [Bradyrhizobium sp. CCBAU 51753]
MRFKMMNALGNGAYLHTADGHRIIEAISSWWIVTHGFCHPHWGRDSGMSKLNQIIFASYTHDAADEVAEQLLKLAPVGLDYPFFSDSRSTTVDRQGVTTLGSIAAKTVYFG